MLELPFSNSFARYRFAAFDCSVLILTQPLRDGLAGRLEGSDEEAELKAIVDAIEAYEAKR